MGKKQHSKDQLYLTATEWQADWGGKKHAVHLPWKTLPFDCCAISFRPFETPMCTDDGSIFDLLNIVPYLKKFRRHPVTGNPLAAGDLVKLHFHKNGDGKYHCPVLFKVFNSHTHIVAIKTTGNVYSYEAVKELNVRYVGLKSEVVAGGAPRHRHMGPLPELPHEKPMAMPRHVLDSPAPARPFYSSRPRACATSSTRRPSPRLTSSRFRRRASASRGLWSAQTT